MNFRFSLLGLIGLTTLAGLGCAALVKPSDTWLSIVVSLTAAAIIVQVLRAMFCGPRQSAAAAGWLAFALTYLALTIGPWLSTQVGPRLLTSKAIEQARLSWPEQLNVPSERPELNLPVFWDDNNGLGRGGPSLYGDGAPLYFTSGFAYSPPAPNYFQLSAHWLFAWIAGWLGAALAAHFHDRNRLSKAARSEL